MDNYSRGLSSTVDEAQIVSVQKGWESIDEKKHHQYVLIFIVKQIFISFVDAQRNRTLVCAKRFSAPKTGAVTWSLLTLILDVAFSHPSVSKR